MPRVDAITLRQLRILAAVASNGSLTAAGERLGLTPSAVHAQIKNLETALAVPLLRRADNGAGSEPTREAALVLEAGRRIEVGAPIMMVATAARHRQAAFQGAEYLMDWLKSRAPFWKREIGPDGPGHWVEARDADEGALSRW